MQQQQQLDGAMFTTTRRRQTIVAVISTLCLLALVPHNLDFVRDPVGWIPVALLWLIFLVVAVRNWLYVLRKPIQLHMTPTDLRVSSGGRQATIPWYEVADIRIDGKPKRPWIVARLTPAVDPAEVPVSRRRDGSYKLFPIAHGQSTKRRLVSRQHLRTAIMANGRRYLDPV
ncbi:hypothetical protein ACQPYH_02600 [Kribbella sp. CA-245084]|uniref:hypothetical protein n=1 Tax=Kribbella sp. CA-245084 TaxID=3239940 RepID=UPI003D90F34F